MTREETDRIFKSIQDIVNTNPVVVVGCGASMNYGLPGIWDLANAIKDDFTATPPKNTDSKKCIDDVISKLNLGSGLEDAMLNIRCTEEVEERILKIVWNQIEQKNRDVFVNYVQTQKRLSFTDLLAHLIYNRANEEINVVTTNYDCLIEYAASQTDAYVNCGCTQSLAGKFIGFTNKKQLKSLKDYEGCVNIYKIHGSLDWFVDNNGNMFYYPNSAAIPINMKPCIITPGLNKYERALEEPHRSLISSVDELFKSANGYICFGYGFNDKHIQPMLLKTAVDRKKKVLIITKDLTDKIESEVIAKVPNYIIVYSDGNKGTIFKSSTEKNELVDNTMEYWKLENFMNDIVK